MDMDKETRQQLDNNILLLRNVVGYSGDIQNRIKKGVEIFCGEPVLRVYVAKKKSRLSLLFTGDKIPKKVAGMKTDVVEIGEIRALITVPSPRLGKWGTMIGGISVGHKDVTAGTFARTVYMSGKPYFLTNNHIAANSMLDSGEGGKVGDVVYQPGPADIINELQDTPGESYACGNLAEAIPLSVTGPNIVDAALIAPSSARGWYNYCQLSLDTGELILDSPKIGDAVIKSGRTTGITRGTIIDIDATLLIGGYREKVISFEHQIVIQPMGGAFVQGGDSGSLLLRDDNPLNAMIGLIFAGSSSAGIANRLDLLASSFSSPLTFEGPFYVPAGSVPTPPGEDKEYRYLPVTAQVVITVKALKEDRETKLVLDAVAGIQVGENFNIAGHLVDAITDTPVADRQVEIVGEQTVITGQDGSFSYMHPPYSVPGEYVVVVQFAGDEGGNPEAQLEEKYGFDE